MFLLISIHEYEIKPGVNYKDFENAVKEADEKGLFKLPGLKEYHFVKGIRGRRKDKYAAIWIYESKEAWEELWGPADNPKNKEEYPANWRKWEDEVLAPFLRREPDKITFTSYQKVDL